MRHFVILFLIAFHVTHLQASLSVAEDSINGANDLELGAIETSDVDQYEGELELKLGLCDNDRVKYPLEKVIKCVNV